MDKNLKTKNFIGVFTEEELETLQKQQKEMYNDAWIAIKGSLIATPVPIHLLKNLSFLDEEEPDYSEEDFVIFSDEAVNILNIEDSDFYSCLRTTLPKNYFYIVHNSLGKFFVTVTLNGKSKKPTLTTKSMDDLRVIRIHKELETGIQTYSEYYKDTKE